jgi:hypothetical protein
MATKAAPAKPVAKVGGKKHVFSVSEAKELLTKNPNALTFEKKKPPKVVKKKPGVDNKSSVDYYNVHLNNASGKYTLLMRIQNVTIISAPPDPTNANDPRAKYVNEDSCAIGSSIAAAGEFGEVLILIEKAFFDYVDKMKKSGEFDEQTIRRDMLQKKIKTGDDKGKLLDSPVFRMIYDDRKFATDYYDTTLQGTPRSDIRDASRVVTNAKGVKENAPAMVDGEPINKNNLHKFATKGSVIVDGRLHMEQFSVSNMGVALKIGLGRAVIRHVVPSHGYDDDDGLVVDDGNDSGPSTPVTSSSNGKSADDTDPPADDVVADDTADDTAADDTAAGDDAVDAGYDADNVDG